MVWFLIRADRAPHLKMLYCVDVSLRRLERLLNINRVVVGLDEVRKSRSLLFISGNWCTVLNKFRIIVKPEVSSHLIKFGFFDVVLAATARFILT